MANCLQIVTSRLLNSLVGSNGCISGGTCEILTLLEWDVLTFAVLVALGQTKINNVYIVSGGVGASNQEVVWLDITMNDSLFVDFLDTTDELNCDHQDSLEIKLALA